MWIHAILYFTKVEVCDGLGTERQTNWSFSRDDLRSTHRLFLCLQFGPFLSSYQHSTFLKPHLPKPPWHLLCLRHTTQIYQGGINAACTMWLVKVKNSSDGRGQLVKKQVQWAEGVRDKWGAGLLPGFRSPLPSTGKAQGYQLLTIFSRAARNSNFYLKTHSFKNVQKNFRFLQM